MSKEKRRVPKLRFPGFTEDWEQRKFGEIYERTSQKNDLTYGIDKIISVANMYFKIDATVGSEEYLKTYNVFKLGDIAFEGHTNKEYSYGRFVENTIGDGIVSHIFDVFTPRINLDINFWKDLIKYEPIMGPILRRCTKASRMMSNLTSKEFLEEKILCPTLEEQKLIGEFIVRIDKNITLHQRKLEHLNLKKKALLQKLFPKNGERYPELRFPGYTDAWEQRKLGNLATVEMNKRIFKEQTTTKGDIPFYKIGTFGSDADSFISRELFEEYKNKYPYPNIGDILISASGSIGRTVVYNGEDAYYQDSNIVWLNHNGQIDNSFLLQFYNQVKWAGLEGSTIKRLYNKNILETNIALPKIEEQRLIGKFFKLVDSSITLHQRKLEHLQLQKKALLQQMFV